MSDSPAPPLDDDPDRTVIRPAVLRGFGLHVLPRGMRIEGLEITDLIGEGGFGIVYRAYDATLEREVAVKEYLPASLAMRAPDSLAVTVRNERFRETFEAGLKSFVNEAKLLARFDHPSLLKVYRFWQANSTAYMAMPFYQGPTLKDHLKAAGRAPDEHQLREWLRPLLDALSVMHKENCFHRDIAPDNILLTDRGPLLLDFGAARRVIGDMTQALTVVLKPGYAPIEQYGETASMAQGAWTDLYALASVVHYAITGRAPIASVERMMGAELRPLSEVAAGRYRPEFLAAIDHALALRPTDRPQSIAAFREELNAGLADDSAERLAPTGFGPSAFNTSGFSTSSFDETPRSVRFDDPEPSVALEPGAVSRSPVPRVAPDVPAAPAAPDLPVPTLAAAAPAEPGARRRVLAAAALLGVAALGGAAWWFTAAQRNAVPPAAALPAPSVAPVPDVVTPAPAVVTPAPAPEPAAVPVPAPAPPPVAAEVPTVAPPAPAPPAPVPPPASPPERRAAPEPRKPVAADPAPAPRSAGRPERCSDILQKASLDTLTAEEATFLRTQCR